MRPPLLEAPNRTSLSEVAPPISNSDPEGSEKIAREHSGQPTGSPDESNTEL